MNRIFLYSVLLLPLLLSACSDDSSSPEGDVITVGASTPSAGSRVNLTDDGATTEVFWKALDQIKVANATQNESTTFTCGQAAAGSSTATFAASLSDPYAEGDSLYAFYPIALSVTENNKAAVDYGTQSYSDLESQLNEMSEETAMYAYAKYAGASTSLNFNSAASVLRLKLTFPDSVKITKITLSAKGLVTKATMTVNADGTLTWTKPDTGDMTATFSTPVSASANTELATYMLSVPQDSLNDIKITAVTDSDKVYMSEVTSAPASIEAGKSYSIAATMSIPKAPVGIYNLAIGDIIYSDGGNSTAANYDTYVKTHIGATPVGVCFYVGNQLYDGENTKIGTWGNSYVADIFGYTKKSFTVPTTYHGYMIALTELNNNKICTYADALISLASYNKTMSISNISSAEWFLPSVPVLAMGGFGDASNTAVMDELNNTMKILSDKSITVNKVTDWGHWTNSYFDDNHHRMAAMNGLGGFNGSGYWISTAEGYSLASLYARAIAII